MHATFLLLRVVARVTPIHVMHGRRRVWPSTVLRDNPLMVTNKAANVYLLFS